MNEPGRHRLHVFYENEDFFEVHVRRVRLVMKGVHDECSEAAQLFEFVWFDGFAVGQIGEVADAKTEDGQAAMPDFYRQNGQGILFEKLDKNDFEE